MAQNLATKYSPIIDEVITQESTTNELINRNIDWVGVQTVKVYGATASDMGNYTRSGTSRYGTPAELDDSVQELTTRLDRSFTFTIDKGNNIEQMMIKEAGARLRQQMLEKVIPEIDLRRNAKAAFNAGYTRVVALTTSNAYTEFIKSRTYMTNRKVSATGRMSYISAEYYELLQQDDKFNKACNLSKEQANTGMIPMIDGSMIKVQPEDKMPFGCSCITFATSVLNAADKLEEYKIHDNPPGINGWLVEGRNMFDGFMLTNQKPKVYVIFGQLRSLGTISAAGEAENGTLITANVPYVAHYYATDTYTTDFKLMYKLGSSTTATVAVGDSDSGFTNITITPTVAGGNVIAPTEIAASTNTHIAVGYFRKNSAGAFECIGGDTLFALVKGEAAVSG